MESCREFFFQTAKLCRRSRLIIHDEIRGAFVKCLKEKLDGLHFGNPLCEDTDIGPIANEAQFDKIRSMVDRARQEGATIAAGGSKKVVPGLTTLFHGTNNFENVS